MQSRLFKELLRRPAGLGALLVLGLFYFAAIFAGFLSPYALNEQSLTHTYHPPTRIFWGEGGLRVQAYERVDPSIAQYQAIAGKSYSLGLFVKGFEYRLFGVLPLDRHLFGIRGQDAPVPLPAQAQQEPHLTQTQQKPTSHEAQSAVLTAPAQSAITAKAAEPETPRVYLLGSDSTGRDVFSRLLYGSRISLSIALIAIAITMLIGFLIGGLSGYFGGRFDFFAMRGVEFLMVVPTLYLLLALRSALAPYFAKYGSDKMFLLIVVILSLIGWAGTARVLRGLTLSLRRQQFVLAAESMGQSPLAILRRHILPNLSSYLLAASTLAIPGYILGEAALSFLGLGIQEPATSWGLMLSQAQDIKVFYLNFWWLLTPGVTILATVMAFNILGDNLREIIARKS